MIFRTAILQQQSQKGLVKENLETVLSAVKSASERHADILLLPECFLTGYFFPVTNKDALETDCAEIQIVCRAAAEYSFLWQLWQKFSHHRKTVTSAPRQADR